jgi:hypothetical protein
MCIRKASLKTETKLTNSTYFPTTQTDIHSLKEQNSDNSDFERELLNACLEMGELSHQQEGQNREIKSLKREIGFLECDLQDVRNEAFEFETEEISSRNFQMGFTVELNETSIREPSEEEIPSRNAWLKVERAKSAFDRQMLEAGSTSEKLEAARVHLEDLSKELFQMNNPT